MRKTDLYLVDLVVQCASLISLDVLASTKYANRTEEAVDE